MATTNSLRPVLDRKEWEMMTPAPIASGAGMSIISANGEDPKQLQLYVNTLIAQYLYSPVEDAWIQLPTVTLGGTVAFGCGAYSSAGPTGTASAGSTTTLTSTLAIPGSVAGYTVRITGGTGAGQIATISSNTTGANAVFTFPALGVALDNTSTFELRTGRFWVFNGGTLSATSFQVYDVALNTWTAKSITGLAASVVGDTKMISMNSVFVAATGTATSGSATTIVNSGKAWATNQWANFQVRITAGTGAGKVAVITSNTGTTLTFPTVTTVLDSTSVYSIEGDDNALYLLGNNAVTLYKYSISGNSWSTLAPGVARGAITGLAPSGTWVRFQPEANWTNENAIINGQRIYSFRGGATSTLDYYDITTNAWTNAVAYARAQETFTTGSGYTYTQSGYIYIQKDATGRFFRYSPSQNAMDPWSTLLITQGAGAGGDRVFDTSYTDGATTIRWVNFLMNTNVGMYRQMII